MGGLRFNAPRCPDRLWSVEQGLKIPCPWFDSESGHHYLKNPPKRRVLLSASGLFIELRSIIRRTAAHPFRGQRGKRVVHTPAALVRVRAPLFKEPAQKAGFCFSHPDSSSNSVLSPAAWRRCACAGLRCLNQQRTRRPDKAFACRHQAQPRVRRLMCIAWRRCAFARAYAA